MSKPAINLERDIHPLKFCRTEDQRKAIQRLRIDRYSERYPSIKNPGQDAFDAQSVTLFGEDEQQQIVSSCRLVFDSKIGLPEDPMFRMSTDKLRHESKNLVEASRFVNNRHSTTEFKDYYRAFYAIGVAHNVDVILFVMEERNYLFHKRMLGAELLPERDDTGFGCNLSFVTVAWHLELTPAKFHKWAKPK